MSDSNSNLPQMQPSQASKEVTFNSIVDALSPSSTFGRNFATTSGLVWGYLGGRILVDGVSTLIANATLSLTASSTCYIEVARAGIVSFNTIGFTPGRVPLYIVVTGASTVTSYSDVRPVNTIKMGRAVVAMANTNQTLTPAQAQCVLIECTGALTAQRDLIVPLDVGMYAVYANVTGGFGVRVIGASGTGVVVPQGQMLTVYMDGTNALADSSSASITALTGDVTASGTGSVAATIASAAVTLAKMANLTANSVIGNNTGSAATPIALTAAQLTAMLNTFTTSLAGVVPASGGGATNFLRADGSWAAPPGAGGSTFLDGSFRVQNTADATKQFALDASGISASTTRTWTVPNVSGTFVGLATTQTLTNKTLTSPILTTPVIDGLPTGTGVASAATASTVASRDANGNLSAANFIPGYATTATAAGTTTLTVTSAQTQVFTGTSTQTVVLPVTSTLSLGMTYRVVNNSTGAVTVQSSGANNILVLRGGTEAVFTCVLTSGASADSWMQDQISTKNIPINVQSAAYTITASDFNAIVQHPSSDATGRTFTLDSNTNVPRKFGVAVTFINGNAAGVVTIAVTTDTMRLAGAGTTGSRSLAANGIATAVWISPGEWQISGTGLT
jgi:hypothetical protein